MRQVGGVILAAVVITWAVIDYGSLETVAIALFEWGEVVVVALFEQFVQLVQRLSDFASSEVSKK